MAQRIEETVRRTAPPQPVRTTAQATSPSADGVRRNRASPAVRRRRLTWAAVAAATLLLLALWLRPTPVAVETRSVAAGPLETVVQAEGIARVRERFEVAAPVHGRLERLTLREGDAITRDAVVARIAPLPLDPQASTLAQARLAAAVAAAGEAETRAAQARAAAEQTERSTARLRTVAQTEPGAVSADALERAETQAAVARREYDAAAARTRAAQAEVAAARAALLGAAPAGTAVAVIRSPVAGTVLRVHEASARVVSAGTPLLQIGDAADLEIVVDVLSTDAVRIRPGAAVRLLDWGGPDTLAARVRLVEPAGFTRISALGVEEQRVNVIADLDATPAALGDGYRVQAEIVTWHDAHVVRAPNSALFRADGDWRVFVVRAGRARVVPVRTGHRGRTWTEILAGVEPGDEVIVFPTDRIREGTRVRAR